MTPASRKAKGRRAQNSLVRLFLEYDPRGMYKGAPMGTNGSDVQDPGERLPFTYIEVRCRETLQSLNSIMKEMGAKAGESWLYVASRNEQAPLYMLNEEGFRRLFAAYAYALRKGGD